jgi:hypothetical protein
MMIRDGWSSELTSNKDVILDYRDIVNPEEADRYRQVFSPRATGNVVATTQVS